MSAIYCRLFPAARSRLNRSRAIALPLLAYGWRRGLIASHLRSAVAPWIDRPQQIDVIRDGLDARGAALLRVPELLP
jgi:hypothetical protein